MQEWQWHKSWNETYSRIYNQCQILAHCIGIDPPCLFHKLPTLGIVGNCMLTGVIWRSYDDLTLKISHVSAIKLRKMLWVSGMASVVQPIISSLPSSSMYCSCLPLSPSPLGVALLPAAVDLPQPRQGGSLSLCSFIFLFLFRSLTPCSIFSNEE